MGLLPCIFPSLVYSDQEMARQTSRVGGSSLFRGDYSSSFWTLGCFCLCMWFFSILFFSHRWTSYSTCGWLLLLLGNINMAHWRGPAVYQLCITLYVQQKYCTKVFSLLSETLASTESHGRLPIRQFYVKSRVQRKLRRSQGVWRCSLPHQTADHRVLRYSTFPKRGSRGECCQL